MPDTVTPPRPPWDILYDYDRGSRQQVSNDSVDMRAVLWEILADVQSSYRLAITGVGVPEATVDTIETTVTDYLVNNYGDD